MGLRVGSLRIGRLSWAAAAALTLLLVPGAALAVTPYQAEKTEVYYAAVAVDGHPTVYLSSASFGDVLMTVRLAQVDKKICDRKAYAGELAKVRAAQASDDQLYHDIVRDIAIAKAQIESDEAVYDAAKEAFNAAAADGENTQAAYARMLKAQQILFRDQYMAGAGGEADAEHALQDANTLATVIIWLEAIPFNCPEPKTYTAPPPPPPPSHAPAPAQMHEAPRCARAGAVIKEINDARTDPQRYLRSWRGANAEAEDFMRRQAPLPPVEEITPLDDAAQRHANDQGPIGLQGHVGTDGSKPMQRIHDAGLYAMINAEVISVSEVTAAGEIHQLITDPGNVGHPHRDDLFNPQLTLAGVGCSPDKRYGQITVIDLSSPSVR